MNSIEATSHKLQASSQRCLQPAACSLQLAIISTLLTAGCSSVSAPQVGQTVGSIVGTAIAPGVGTTLGSLAGMMAGMLAQGQIDKSTEKKERKVLGEQMARPDAAEPAPVMIAGVPTRVWVDETTQNGQVNTGRFETRQIQ